MAGSQYGSPPFNGSRGRPALLRGPSYGIARRGAAENDPVLPVHGAHGPTCLSTGRHCSAGSGPRTGVHTHVTRTRGRHLHRKIAFEPKTLDCATLPSGACRRSEEHTSELQSLMRISYAVFCLKKKNQT